MKIYFLIPVLLLCSMNSAKSQTQEAPPCLQPEHQELSYLEGDWDVVSRQRVNFEEDRWNESTAGKAKWSRILGGCAYQEEWTGNIDGEAMEWIQIITYNYRESKWEQVFIDWAHGNTLTAEGFIGDGKLIFNAPQTREGKLLIDRTTFHKVHSDSVTWTLKTSLDGGNSWVTFWEMKYSRSQRSGESADN